MAIAAGATASFRFCCQGAKRDSLPALLATTTWVEFRDSLDDSIAFHRAGVRHSRRSALTRPRPSPLRRPMSLPRFAHFDVDDAPFFLDANL
jgi:hypothetical protein